MQCQRTVTMQKHNFWKCIIIKDTRFIHSFIHSGELIQCLFKTLLLRGAPSPVMAKEEGLEGDVKFGRAGHQQGTQLNGLPTQHRYCIGVSCRSPTGNCEWRTCQRSLHGGHSGIWTHNPLDERRIYQWATTVHLYSWIALTEIKISGSMMFHIQSILMDSGKSIWGLGRSVIPARSITWGPQKAWHPLKWVFSWQKCRLTKINRRWNGEGENWPTALICRG